MSSPSNPSARRRVLHLSIAALMMMATLTAITPGVEAAAAGSKIDGDSSTAPNIVSATFRDADDNGRFDRVQIHFEADLAAANNRDDDREPIIETIRPQDFSVSGHVVKGCVASLGLNCDSSLVDDDGAGGTPTRFTITLIIEENLDYLTGGALPTVSYTAGTIVDADGTALASVSSVATRHDRAEPILAAVYGQAGDAQLKAQLSETIVNIGGALVVQGVIGDAALDEGDLCYVDGGGTAQEVVTLAVSGRTATITVEGAGNNDADSIQANDVNQAKATASIGFGDADPPPNPAPGSNQDCSFSAVADAAANPVAAAHAVNPGAPPATIPGSGARPIHDIDTFGSGTGWLNGVYTDIGRNRAYLVFNGPIERVGGGAWDNQDIQYVNNVASQDGATGIDAINFVPGSNIIELVLTGVVSANDIGSDGINIIGGTVQAAGDTDNVMTTTISGRTLDNSATPSATDLAPLGFNRLQIYPNGALSIDNDRDGIIDAMLVQFNGEIDPLTLGIATEWRARELNGANSPGVVTVVGLGVSGTIVGCQAGSLPAITNAVYVCIDEANNYATDTEFVLGHDAGSSGLSDRGGQAIASWANLIARDTARPVPTLIETFDADDSGQIDRLKVTYSEPMDDSTFLASEWSAVHYGPDNALGGGDDTPYPITGLDTTIATDTGDDNVLWLEITESGTPDTEIVPKVTFARGGGLKDLSGIAATTFDMTNQGPADLPPSGAGSVSIVDRAKPVIVSAKTAVGSTSLIVQFSENVDSAQASGTSSDLNFGDFVWDNVDTAGVSGINEVDAPNAAGDLFTLTLDQTVTQADFDGDRITVNLNSVYDQIGNVGNQVYATLTAIGGPTISGVKTLDVQPVNGWIDGLEVTFSEAVDDVTNGQSNLELAEWSIVLDGRTIDDASSDNFVLSTDADDWNGNGVIDGSESGTIDGVDDDKIYLFFDDDLDLDHETSGATHDGWRGDLLPEARYVPDSVDGFIRSLDDGAPMTMASQTSTDGAGPVLLTVSGSEGSDQATLTFSEGVTGTGAGGKLRHQDFTYHNNGGANADSIATVSHTAGSASVSVTFNDDLDATDFGGDEIGTKASIRDAASISAPVLRVGFADLSAPILETIETVDNDGDGLVDHLRLTFSEPLDDGTVGCNHIQFPAVGNPWTIKLGATTVTPTNVVSAIGDTLCAPGGGTDDDTLFLELAESVTLHGGVQPEISYNAIASDAKIVDQASPANQLGAIASFQAIDKVVPVLWDADGQDNMGAEAATQDLDGDGKIDAYRLIFSEPVLDNSFRSQEWLVQDASNGDSHLIDSSDLGTANDATVLIPFSEATEFDGEETPGLTYTNIIGFSDVAGNELASLDGIAIMEVDRARPTVVGLQTGLGLTLAQIEFSEPVARDQAQTQALAPSDFDYVNGNGAGAGGISAVNVAAGGETGTLSFDQAVNAGDLDLDTISPVTNAITDAAGNFANFAALSLSGELADRTAPGQITDLAVEVGEESLVLTWTTPTADDLDKFDIRISETAITAGNFAAADKVTSGVIGDVATLPNPASGQEQTLALTGLDSTKTFFVAMTTTDVNGLVSDVSNSDSGQPLELDVTTPGGINDLSASAQTANSISIEWTAPGDDDATGTVTSYEVKISETAISAANFDAADDAVVTFDPATLVAGGATQSATVTQIGTQALAPETTYFIAVRGVDEKDQKGGIDTVSATTEMLDITAPTGTLAITSSTHQAGVGTENNDPTFSWSGLTDAESTITYYHVLDQIATTTVTSTAAGSTAGTTASFTDIAPGTWYFHVIGISQGGSSATAHYEIIIEAPAAVDFTSKLEQANEDIRTSIEVEQDGDDNIVTWTLPDTDDEIAGVQVWRSTSPYTLIADLAAGSADFAANSFTDVDAPEGAVYLVTVYFLAAESGGQYDDLDNVPGYVGLSDDEQKDLGTAQTGNDESDGVPAWVWWAIGGFLLLVLIIILIVVLARRGKDDGPEDAWDEPWDTDADAEADTWDEGADEGFETADETWDEPSAPVQAESFQMECPDCDHVFTAHGVKPLTTTCPSCGVKGILN